MFVHAGFRPLWPVIFFLPGMLLGAAYLFAALFQPGLKLARGAVQSQWPRHHWRSGAGLVIVTLAFLAASQVALADPATHESPACEAADAHQAKLLADVLYDKGEYQHAGACYDVSGDQPRAQLAYLKAAGPSSERAARGLRQESDAAKALFDKMQQALRSTH
jgi:hypothetical protein